MKEVRAELKHDKLLMSMAFVKPRSVSKYTVMRSVLRDDPCGRFVVIIRLDMVKLDERE
jgi:hypothetical protein